MKEVRRIILSRTDNLGDVVLTLPLAGILKSYMKDVKIYFIGKAYTRPLIETCEYVDEFIDREKIINDPGILKNINADVIIHVFPDIEIAKTSYRAGIKMRIGTGHRIFHWLYCNQRVNFTRKNSGLHEAELNQKLLAPLGIKKIVLKADIPEYYGFTKINSSEGKFSGLINPGKFNMILHPKSKGSAREWPMEFYYALAKELSQNDFQLFITGTQSEGETIKNEKPEIFNLSHVKDLTGKLNLGELTAFINEADGLVACSTGPLHIAAALGKMVCGIYPPMKPIHPGRWAPLGNRATYLVLDKNCNECIKTENCTCIKSISIAEVKKLVQTWQEKRI